jgi:hypothetical protein
VKRPKLKIFIGSVRIIATGRRKIFKIPNTAAAIKADEISATLIPSIR